MRKTASQKIVILGCGNLAWHLAKQLHALKFELYVYNHRPNPALQLFKKSFRCNIRADFKSIITDADFYFICVSDKNITTVSKRIHPEKKDAVILHTSGSMGINKLKSNWPNTAVFYPVQSFSKSAAVNWSETAILTEGSNALSLKKVNELTKLFSKEAVACSSAERLHMHLAAVLVNNFTNALYSSAFSMVGEKNFKLLLPLIRQTTEKLQHLTPLDAQTGPAKRKDKAVLKKHLSLLKKNKDLHKLYGLLSRLIQQQQTGHA